MITDELYVTHDLAGLVSEIKMVYHPILKPSERPTILKSEDAYRVVLANWDLDTIYLYEELKLILMNAGNKVIGIVPLSKGGMTAAICDARMVFMAALQTGATYLMLVHNHPSGFLLPSEADKYMTQKIKEGCKYLDIVLRDHLIINSEGCYSFADQGLV